MQFKNPAVQSLGGQRKRLQLQLGIRYLSLLSVAIPLLMGLASCQKPAPVTEASPTPTVVSPSPSIAASPAASPTPNQQTYREKNGLFQIAFPKGYTHKTTGSGVAFVSADQKFAGAVDFSPAEGKQLSADQLEASLKAEFTNRLKAVSWQTVQKQPDGSLRLDWTGTDKSGDALDAVSIVEQRGNYVFVLNLFGINKPYQNYNTDAEAIVNGYQIQPQASPQAQPQSPANSPQPQQ